MADIQALNSNAHRDLRVIVKRGAEFGENTHLVPVVADELRSLVLEYPVIFVKDQESGRFNMCAMLGFEKGENLFLDGEEWDAIDDLPGLHVATGFSGHGFGIGPGAGKAIAGMLTRQDSGIDISPLRLGRFFDGSPIRPQSSI